MEPARISKHMAFEGKYHRRWKDIKTSGAVIAKIAKKRKKISKKIIGKQKRKKKYTAKIPEAAVFSV